MEETNGIIYYKEYPTHHGGLDSDSIMADEVKGTSLPYGDINSNFCNLEGRDIASVTASSDGSTIIFRRADNRTMVVDNNPYSFGCGIEEYDNDVSLVMKQGGALSCDSGGLFVNTGCGIEVGNIDDNEDNFQEYLAKRFSVDAAYSYITMEETINGKYYANCQDPYCESSDYKDDQFYGDFLSYVNAGELKVCVDGTTIIINSDCKLQAVGGGGGGFVYSGVAPVVVNNASAQKTVGLNYSNGLGTDASGNLEVKYDGETIRKDAGGKLKVSVDGSTIYYDQQAGCLKAAGGGGQTYTAGTGIGISNNVISAKIDNSSIKADGSGVIYAEGCTAGDGIVVDGNEVSANVDDSTIKIDDATNKIKGNYHGTGAVSISGNTIGVSVDGSTIQVVDNKLTAVGGGQTYTAGDGIDITNNAISVDLSDMTARKNKNQPKIETWKYDSDFDGGCLVPESYSGYNEDHIEETMKNPLVLSDNGTEKDLSILLGPGLFSPQNDLHCKGDDPVCNGYLSIKLSHKHYDTANGKEVDGNPLKLYFGEDLDGTVNVGGSEPFRNPTNTSGAPTSCHSMKGLTLKLGKGISLDSKGGLTTSTNYGTQLIAGTNDGTLSLQSADGTVLSTAMPKNLQSIATTASANDVYMPSAAKSAKKNSTTVATEITGLKTSVSAIEAIMATYGTAVFNDAENVITETAEGSSNSDLTTNDAVVNYVKQKLSAIGAMSYVGTCSQDGSNAALLTSVTYSTPNKGDVFVAQTSIDASSVRRTLGGVYIPSKSYNIGDMFIYNGTGWDDVKKNTNVVNNNRTLPIGGLASETIATVDGTAITMKVSGIGTSSTGAGNVVKDMTAISDTVIFERGYALDTVVNDSVDGVVYSITSSDNKVSVAHKSLATAANAGDFVKTVSQDKYGKITVMPESFVDEVTILTKESSVAPTTKAIADYVDANAVSIDGFVGDLVTGDGMNTVTVDGKISVRAADGGYVSVSSQGVDIDSDRIAGSYLSTIDDDDIATVATVRTAIETIPGHVNADWNATSGAAQILNKPNLSTVATTGDYEDLDNKPNLATVAVTGSYGDLKNKPVIPVVPTNVSAFTNDAGYITIAEVPQQVNADWNATSGVSQILNKPTLFSGSYNDLTDKPTIPTVPTNVSAFTNDAGYVSDSDYHHTDNNYTDSDAYKVSRIITTGDGTKYLNDLGNYVAVSQGGAVWGGISGTLSNQTDLKNALDAKVEGVSINGVTAEKLSNVSRISVSGKNGISVETSSKGAVSVGHSNSVEKQTTKRLVKVGIDSFGHISSYGNAILDDISNIDTEGAVNGSVLGYENGNWVAKTVSVDNQTVKVGNTTFGPNSSVNIKGGSNVSIVPNTESDSITISATVPQQVNADWNATSGVAQILNKPTIPTVPTNVSAFTNDAGYVNGVKVNGKAVATSSDKSLVSISGGNGISISTSNAGEVSVSHSNSVAAQSAKKLLKVGVDSSGHISSYQEAVLGDLKDVNVSGAQGNYVLRRNGLGNSWGAAAPAREIIVDGTTAMQPTDMSYLYLNSGKHIKVSYANNKLSVDHANPGTGTAPTTSGTVVSTDGVVTGFNVDSYGHVSSVEKKSISGAFENQRVKSGQTTFSADSVVDIKSGANISVTPNASTNTIEISAIDTTYTAGTNVTISNSNVISATDTKYAAGTNVSISNQNVISATNDNGRYEDAISFLNRQEWSLDPTTYQGMFGTDVFGTCTADTLHWVLRNTNNRSLTYFVPADDEYSDSVFVSPCQEGTLKARNFTDYSSPSERKGSQGSMRDKFACMLAIDIFENAKFYGKDHGVVTESEPEFEIIQSYDSFSNDYDATLIIDYTGSDNVNPLYVFNPFVPGMVQSDNGHFMTFIRDQVNFMMRCDFNYSENTFNGVPYMEIPAGGYAEINLKAKILSQNYVILSLTHSIFNTKNANAATSDIKI